MPAFGGGHHPPCACLVAAFGRFAARLHRDQRGVISILTVFAVLLLAALLGMVMNVGRQVDGKIRMQNAADAVAYSGGVVIARGMNTLAFTNHLLFDVFALTAWAREATERHSDKYIAGILAAWDKAGRTFQTSGLPKFQRLGQAIVQKVPLEQDLVSSFSDWAKAAGDLLLPTLDEILQQELIPQFQQAVVQAYPDIAQQAALEAALLNGRPDFGRGDLFGVLWRTSVVAVGGAAETYESSLPVIDPLADPTRLSEARRQREGLAKRYLGVGSPVGPAWFNDAWHFQSWNDQTLYFFDIQGKMSQYATLFRNFSCGQLEKLLAEYPDSNLPYLIRTRRADVLDANSHLDQHFTYVGVAYWNQLANKAPMLLGRRLYQDPTESDAVTFAQVRVFIPHRRLVWLHHVPSTAGGPSIGGVPGEGPGLPPPPSGGGTPVVPPDEPTPPPLPDPGESWTVGRQPHVEESWSLLNQHWTVHLVPATVDTLADILQTQPQVPGLPPSPLRLPSLGGLQTSDLGRINTH